MHCGDVEMNGSDEHHTAQLRWRRQGMEEACGVWAELRMLRQGYGGCNCFSHPEL